LLRRANAHQRSQIVSQHLGMHIHHQRMLRQPRDALQFAAMLEALERLLNTPTLMVKLPKNGCRELADWQIGRHHANQSIGCHAFDQAHLWRDTRAAIVFAVPLVGLVERSHGIDLIAVRKSAYRSPAATGLLAAHAKPNIVLSQIGHQPSRRIAPIKDQHIIRPQARQRLKQHLALSAIGTMHAGVQRQFSARQIQSKQALISFGMESLGKTGTNRWHQHRGITCHQSQTVPTRYQAQCISSFDHKGVQVLQASPGQLVPGLGETTVRNATLPVTINRQAAEEGIKHDLLRGRPHREQSANQLGQRQLVGAGKGCGEFRMTSIGEELDRIDALSELRKK